MSSPSTATAPTGASTRTGRRLRVLLAVVVVLHLAALYWPQVTVEGPVTWSDKVVHVLLFGVPTALALLARARPRLVVALLALHAPVSELLQHYVLPHRSGDVWDAVADLSGVVLGVTVVVVGRRLRHW